MELDKELELIERAKEDLAAFDELYELYFGKIYGFCLNRLSNKELAEDITSQVFVAAVENIHKIDTSKRLRFGAWLFKVANNRMIDYFRKNKLPNNAFDDYQGEDNDDVLDDMVFNEKQQKIAIVLKELKPKYQQVITLRFFTELSNPEIAEVMGTKTSNVAVILHRALKKFKKIFEKKYPTSEIFEDI